MATLQEHIYAEGEAEAKRILEQDDAEVQQLVLKREEARARADARAQADAKAEYDARVYGKVSAARLEAQKILLRAKAEVLDAVYARALTALTQLPRARGLALLKIALANGEAGEEACLNPTDDAAISASWWKTHAPKGVVRASTTLPIAGGVVLRGPNADKNCSWEAEMALFRAQTEIELARRLFAPAPAPEES